MLRKLGKILVRFSVLACHYGLPFRRCLFFVRDFQLILINFYFFLCNFWSFLVVAHYSLLATRCLLHVVWCVRYIAHVVLYTFWFSVVCWFLFVPFIPYLFWDYNFFCVQIDQTQVKKFAVNAAKSLTCILSFCEHYRR